MELPDNLSLIKNLLLQLQTELQLTRIEYKKLLDIKRISNDPDEYVSLLDEIANNAESIKQEIREVRNGSYKLSS